MRKARKYFLVFLVIIILISVFYFFKSRSAKLEYTTEKAQVGNFVQTVSATGRVKSPQEVGLSFSSSGQITEMLFETGDLVKKGQRMAQIDKGTLYLELKQANLDLKFQKLTLENMKKKKETYSKEQREAQKLVVRRQEEQIRIIKHFLNETVLTAPLDGIVIRKNYSTGESVRPNEVVYVIAESGKLEVEADIPEVDVVNLQTGQKASLTLDALPPDEKFEGQIFKIDPAPVEIQGVVYYKAYLDFLSSDPRIKNGMTVDVDVVTNQKNDVVFVPLRSVKLEDGHFFVEILKRENEKSEVEKRFVQTGLRSGEGTVEITAGLRGGEEIVVLATEKK